MGVGLLFLLPVNVNVNYFWTPKWCSGLIIYNILRSGKCTITIILFVYEVQSGDPTFTLWSFNSLPASSPNVLQAYSYVCVIESSQSVSIVWVYPTSIPLRSEIPHLNSDTNKETSQKKVKRILVRAQTVMSAKRSQPQQQEPSGPQDEAQNSTEGGKQIQRPERNKHDKATETYDKCLLDGSLKLDLCQLLCPKGQLPATSNILHSQ